LEEPADRSLDASTLHSYINSGAEEDKSSRPAGRNRLHSRKLIMPPSIEHAKQKWCALKHVVICTL
jgi:hypothetical protein